MATTAVTDQFYPPIWVRQDNASFQSLGPTGSNKCNIVSFGAVVPYPYVHS